MSTRFHFPVLLCVLLMTGGCDEKVTVKDACGDGFLDPGEDCDGAELQGASCESLGYYDRLADLACAPDCTFDVSVCGHRCGDGTIEADEGEVCDGSNLAGQTCIAHGFSGGVLRCAADCSWDLTGCAGQCGNGMIEGAEACDDSDGDSGDGCSAACAVEAGWACTTANPSVCAPICGDGLVVGPDECEGTDFGGRTCADFGYHAGALVCLAGCVTDTAGCDGRCGDGELQAAFEDCDGAALGGATCASAGFYEGAVACASDCTLDTSGCALFCGDGQLQGAHGEDCDGTNLAGQDCEDFGLRPGTLACDASCAWDFTGCPGRCGDAVIQAAYESCDGVILAGETCESRGHYPGTLRCDPDTCDFDTVLCGGTCGDGWIAGMYGEECDGTELVGQTCENLGYLFRGELACTPGCRLDPLSCRQIMGGDGAQHTCVALNDGTARCWGDNAYGSLGDGTTYDRTSPVTVGNLSNAVQVCTGSQFTCALTSDQTVKCWGRGPSGQFGDGTTGQRVLPGAFVSGLVGVTDLTCGTEHVCAVTVDRIVWCWGRNAYGAIGDGTTTDALVPAQAFANP